jgi:hypothetical protein
MKMKLLISFVCTLVLASSVFAQTSCSAKVTKEYCETISDAMKVLDHGVMPGTAFPVEVLTTSEFQKRLDDYAARDEATEKQEIFPACNEAKNYNGEHCQLALKHYFTKVIGGPGAHTRVMFNNFTRGIAFLRDTPSSHGPDRILVSVEAVSKDGELDVSRLYSSVHFICGFIEGVFSQFL